MAELWKEAGLPDGVFNVLNGDKVAVDGLLTHPEVQSISFVGSTPIAKYVYETGTAHGKRVQALGGAKNHMLVLPDADLDLAADQAVNAGFGSAGERCMAISAVVAVGEIGDELVAKIKERALRLRTGDGTRGCDMGPLVTAAARTGCRATSTPARRPGATAGRRRARAERGRRRRGLLRRPDAVRPRDHRHEHLHRRDLRAGAVGGPGRHATRTACS